ncbi:MAG: beta-ketoacyl-[acyl-carrier-protein] synthase family protein [Phycisphaerae bacterium]|nr:beta-ketoacyl-[acyl-carrier-protein] synthase family protein [Phycisphaerae bacterium]
MNEKTLFTPIAVTGLSMISAQGKSLRDSWGGITAAGKALRPWSEDPSDNLGPLLVASCGDLPRPDDLPATLWASLARTQQLAALAADEALTSAGLPRRLGRASQAMGLFLATTVCGMDKSEQFHRQYRENPERTDTRLMRRIQPYEVLAFIARRHRLTGPRILFLSTCVGSAMAIGAACDAIGLGRVQMALAGGTEALCRLLLSGFNSLRLVAPNGCQPFDAQRRGITVGEGAALLVLESPAHAKARGAQPIGYVRGFGATCDAHHITAPEPSGQWAAAAITSAVRESGLSPGDIGYINAHGTGTRDNDAMEARAISAAFGALGAPVPPMSSTKRLTGHTFAAAGAIEAAICLQAMATGLLPPNAGLAQADVACNLPLVLQSRPARTNAVLSCNFAFGGNNTALVFSRQVEMDHGRPARKGAPA